MKIRYPFKNEPIETDTLTVTVSDGDGVAVSGATVSVVPKAETGTVTVTCQDESETPLEEAEVLLSSSNQAPTPQEDSNWVAYCSTDIDGTGTLTIWDKETHQPTQNTDIPYGDYYLFVHHSNIPHLYESELTVDGDENITITLTSGD